MSDPIWGDDRYRTPPISGGPPPPQEGFGSTVKVLIYIGLALAVIVGLAYLLVTNFPQFPASVPLATPSLAPSPTLAPSPSPSPTGQPSPSPSPSSSPSPTAQPSPTPSPQPSPSPSPKPSPTSAAP